MKVQERLRNFLDATETKRSCNSGLDPSSLKEIIGTICKIPVGSGDLLLVMNASVLISLL